MALTAGEAFRLKISMQGGLAADDIDGNVGILEVEPVSFDPAHRLDSYYLSEGASSILL